MSRLFGPMRQVGIVVRDIEKAMRHWVEVCGVGPWFYTEQLPMDEFRYKGRIYDLKVSIALANSGDVQLELIQQRNDVPTISRWLSRSSDSSAETSALTRSLPRWQRRSSTARAK